MQFMRKDDGNDMNKVLLVVGLALAAFLLLVPSLARRVFKTQHPVPPANSNVSDVTKRSFEDATRGILRSLKIANWNEFRHHAASHVQIAEYMLVYLNGDKWTKSQLADLFPPVLFSGRFGKIARPDTNTAGVLLSSCSLLVNINKPQSQEAQYVFNQFCMNVKDTLTMPPNWVQSGEDIQAMDSMPFTGPAIQGKICSNEHWWVGMAFIRGKWLVTNLVVTGH